MNLPRVRVRLWWLTAVVVLVALDLAAARAPVSGRPVVGTMLVLGCLPMANVLAVGLLPLLDRRRARRRPCLVGFEVVGAAALLLSAWCAVYHADALRGVLADAAGPARAFGSAAFLASAAAAVLTPQLVLALLGGWLNASHGPGARVPRG